MEALWIAVVTSILSPILLHFLQSRKLKRITTLVDGTQTALMDELLDALRIQLMDMQARYDERPTSRGAAAVKLLEEKIAAKQLELDARLKQVALVEIYNRGEQR